jgi:hypothetical protein
MFVTAGDRSEMTQVLYDHNNELSRANALREFFTDMIIIIIVQA